MSAAALPITSRFGHFKQLDGWRGVSIILVLIGHAIGSSANVPSSLQSLGQLAELGVTCFFILSGFLITGLLCDEEAVTGRISLKEFYIRRTLRIMPAYYVMLTVTACLALLKLVTDVPWYTFGICAVYLRDIAGRGVSLGHTWSLSLEEQFYLVWPFCLRRIPQKKRIAIAFTGCILVEMWRLVAILTGVCRTSNTFRPDFRIDCILLGCLIAFLWTYERDWLKSVISKLPNTFILFFCLCLGTTYLAETPALKPMAITLELWLSALIMSQLLVNAKTPFALALTHPVFRWFGQVSYSIYLWQQIFLVTKEPSWGLLRSFPLNFVCLLIVACASHYLIERPVLTLEKETCSPFPHSSLI